MNKKKATQIIDGVKRRFWSKVEKRSDCWIWTGARLPKGYGTFREPMGNVVKAHRFAYEMEHGPIPAGALALHSCDNPPCVNVAHLRLGTNDENMGEMAAKGRANSPVGEESKHHRFTEKIILAMRRDHDLGLSYREIGIKHDANRGTVANIIQRKTWKHI